MFFYSLIILRHSIYGIHFGLHRAKRIHLGTELNHFLKNEILNNISLSELVI